MYLEKLYDEVKRCIAEVDFTKLWRGFEPLKFALYTDKECFFDGCYVEKTDAFLANTSIFYKGEWIAIWCVQEEMNPMVLASKIIHEMFHGFQSMNQESRFFDDLEALYYYRYEEENVSLKLQENQLLCRLSTHFDRETFQEFLQIRKYRCENFGYAYHYESCVEQIEGTANFVELYSLKQLSAELFEKKLSEMRGSIINPNHCIPVRAICYDVGALLLYILRENHVAFDDGFSSVPLSETILNGVVGKKYAPEYSTQTLLDDFYVKARETIRNAVEKNVLVTDVPCALLAVNVYNAIYCDNYIISRFFVMFGAEDRPRIEYGDFVIETNEYGKLTKIYKM